MWTEAHRGRHDARLKEIVSLNAVAQVARWLERADPPRSGRATPYRRGIPVRGPRGYDAAKKVLGRKRVALVDADGNWLAVAVVPASVQDRDTLAALEAGKAAWPSLREAILDGAFTAARCQEWSNRHGMRHRVVERDPAQKGFVVLAGRWVVERSFGWLVHWGGLLRDRAGRLDVSAARVACAAILSGVEMLWGGRWRGVTIVAGSNADGASHGTAARRFE